MVYKTVAPTLQGFAHRHTDPDAEVYTDKARTYLGIMSKHLSVKNSLGEYVKEMAHTNSIESTWSMVQRGHDGVYHHFSQKHLHRYITE